MRLNVTELNDPNVGIRINVLGLPFQLIDQLNDRLLDYGMELGFSAFELVEQLCQHDYLLSQ